MPEITFTGTPAEWDAERDRKIESIKEANIAYSLAKHRIPREHVHMDDSWLLALAEATMSPRPVEPPSVVTAVGWRVTWDGAQFAGKHPGDLPRTFKSSHDAAFWASATEAEHDAIRALRDGPTARYEVCGYEHWRGNKYVQTFHVNANRDAESCKQSVQFEIIQSGGGGTAHAIYKRVGGEG